MKNNFSGKQVFMNNIDWEEDGGGGLNRSLGQTPKFCEDS